jgi:parallel beta-helix repeat protein
MRIVRRTGAIPNVLLACFGVGAGLAGADVASAEKVLRVPGEHAAISAAITAAAAGDTILVAPGSYQESVILNDGVVLRAEGGVDETTIAFDEKDPNQAVLTLQRCSNSTQVVGFTIDGRKIAARGILAIGDGSAVISRCKIVGAMSGVECQRNASPYVYDTRIEGATTAGILIAAASADVSGCELVNGENAGLVVRGTTTPLRVRDCRIQSNLKAGVQAEDGEFSIVGGTISGNGNSGLVLQYVSPLIQNVVIEGNANIGIVLENSTGTIQGCMIRNNNFGCVISGTGDPKIFQSTFEDNPTAHVFAEGDVVPIVGGSVENANLFVGATECVIQTQATQPVNASYNYWGKPCSTKDQICRLAGGADVIRKPWVTADLKTVFTSCEEARKHSRTPVTPEEVAEDAEARAAEAAATADPAAAEPTPETASGGAN